MIILNLLETINLESTDSDTSMIQRQTIFEKL